MLRVVGLSTWITIDQSVLQGAVDQDGEFARRGGHGLGFADAERDPAVELLTTKQSGPNEGAVWANDGQGTNKAWRLESHDQ